MDLSTIKKKLQDAQWVAIMLSFINSLHILFPHIVLVSM
jgi:hypothetical protein